MQMACVPITRHQSAASGPCRRHHISPPLPRPATNTDIHHFGWRCRKSETVFRQPRLEALYGSWSASECAADDCLEAQTVADVVADVPGLRRLIAGRLKLIRAGVPVAGARLPWPPLPGVAPAL